jgi:hypothetical protein
MASRDSADTIRFAGDVAAGKTVTKRHQVDRLSRIDQVNVRIYRGSELALQIVPFFEAGDDPERLERTPVLQFAGDKQYVDGDDDAWEFPVEIEIDDDEQIGVEVENTAGSNAYDYSVDFELTRLDGGA